MSWRLRRARTGLPLRSLIKVTINRIKLPSSGSLIMFTTFTIDPFWGSFWAAPQKQRACNRPGRLFATRLVTESWGLATNPPRENPIEDYSTLHRPATKVCNRGGGGTATNPYFESQPRNSLTARRSGTLCILVAALSGSCLFVLPPQPFKESSVPPPAPFCSIGPSSLRYHLPFAGSRPWEPPQQMSRVVGPSHAQASSDGHCAAQSLL